MTIPEEIEELKKKLEQTTDEREQAEVLVELLRRHALLNSGNFEPYCDRLLQLAEKLHIIHYKAWALYYLSLYKRNKGEFEISKELSQQALSFFKKVEDKHGIAATYNNIGNVYNNQSNYPAALKNYFAALEFKKLIGDKRGIASCYNNIGSVYYVQGNYSATLQNYFASLDIKKEIDDKLGIASSYNNIGNVYYEQGNYTEALKNHFSSLNLKKEIDDKQGIAYSYNNIGLVYSEQGMFTEALENFFAALKIRKEIGDLPGVATTSGNIGSIYTKLGNYLKALKFHHAALKFRKDVNDKSGLASSHGNIAVVYEKQANYSEALKENIQAIQIAEEINFRPVIRESSYALTNIFKAINDFENALKYYEKYHDIEKEMLGEESTKQLNQLSFTHNLEQKEKDLEIEQLRNVELKKERDRSEALLLNILPAEVAEELKEKGNAAAKHFDNVTVFFSDFKSFTTVSETLSPQQLVDELHECFSAFDNIMHKHNIEKIKTVGDAYLAVSGLPLANPNHAQDVVKAALEIQQFMAERKKQKESKAGLYEIRVGINSGSVVAGIVGVKKFAYDIWGDTVNTAARMEQNSEAGKINISQTTYELVKDKFNCEYRGEIEAKNKGKLKMYFVA